MFSDSVVASEAAELLDRQRLDRAILIVFNDRFENIDATRGKPGVAPGNKVKVLAHGLISRFFKSLGEASDEIFEFCVGPLILLKILIKAILHSLISQDIIHLFQKRGALAVANAIEEGDSLCGRLNITTN